MNKMMETMSEPRADLKPHAPRIEVIEIPKDYIGAVIGPGGKIIQSIQEETGTVIAIDEIDNVGRVEISSSNKASIEAALAKIRGIVAVPEVGEVYEATVRSVMPYGLFCEFLPGKDGLLHISEIEWKRLEKIEDAGIAEGDKIEVKLIDIDPRSGKFKLSRKVLFPKPERPKEESIRPERPERSERPRGPRGGRR
jgi:polyribonucleotide nucleotidyltransferase